MFANAIGAREFNLNSPIMYILYGIVLVFVV